MPIEKKKRLLVPLNNPARSTTASPFVQGLQKALFRLLGFVFGNLYRLCFGWLDRRTAKNTELRFAADIRTHLPFLFAQHRASIIPNEGVRFPPPRGGAFVTLAVGAIRLRFFGGDGDFSVSVGSNAVPNHWEDFQLVADGIGEWDPARQRYALETFGTVLRARLDSLQQALSEERAETTLNNAVKLHNETIDRYVAKLRESDVTPIVF